MNYAKANGMTTLEMTRAGQNLIKLTQGMPWERSHNLSPSDFLGNASQISGGDEFLNIGTENSQTNHWYSAGLVIGALSVRWSGAYQNIKSHRVWSW
ncbi:hypothetical protein [Algoriphagus sp. Y33]|uniref:hypothetical protein n=1 Tax=Algoriphagus sp. Y33 TaxID=2772483 RepID=UPI001780D6D5|nr:hypothetical protein [Algoriphagus sp. Y33]